MKRSRSLQMMLVYFGGVVVLSGCGQDSDTRQCVDYRLTVQDPALCEDDGDDNPPRTAYTSGSGGGNHWYYNGQRVPIGTQTFGGYHAPESAHAGSGEHASPSGRATGSISRGVFGGAAGAHGGSSGG